MHEHAHELTLGLAFFLGALHALEPGHGKTASLVYLSGERRGFWHPIVLGLSCAVTHLVSLLAVALCVHLTQHLVAGDHGHEDATVVTALQWVSSLLIVGVGIWMIIAANRSEGSSCGCRHHRSHHDYQGTPQKSPARSGYTMTALLGAAVGLLPCPSALAAYFASVAAGISIGAYLVIFLFAAGIAASLITVGFIVQRFGHRMRNTGGWVRAIPWATIRASIILVLGLAYCYRAWSA